MCSSCETLLESRKKESPSLSSVFQEHFCCPHSSWLFCALSCSGIPHRKDCVLLILASHYLCWMAVALHFQMIFGLTQTAPFMEALSGWLLSLLSSFSATCRWLAAPSQSHCYREGQTKQCPFPRNLNWRLKEVKKSEKPVFLWVARLAKCRVFTVYTT